MKSIIHSYKKILFHNTFKNISYLTIGNVLSQIIALVGAFYIPKLLGPEQYGIYNTVIAYVGIFTFISLNGLNKVIIREAARDITKTKEILEAVIGIKNIAALTAIILAIIIVLFIDYEIGTKIYIAVFSVTLLLKGIESSLNSIFQAYEQMKILAYVTVLRQIIIVPLSISLLLQGHGIISLIIVQLAVYLIELVFIYIRTKKIVYFNFFSKVRLNKKLLFPGLKFSLLEFLNILSGRVDLIMLSFLTSPQNVGLYALAYRIVEKGIVLRNPISQSLFPYYAQKYSKNMPKNEFLTKHSLLIFIPLIIFLIPSILFIKPLIIKIIGIEFIESAAIFNVLVFYLIFNFTIIPWGLSLQTTNNEKYSLFIVSICAALNILLNIIFFKSFGIIGIAYSTLIVELIRLTLSVYIVRNKII